MAAAELYWRHPLSHPESNQASLHPPPGTQLRQDISVTVDASGEATDRQIDKLVYELYELTPEEIEVVEQSVR